MYQSIHLQLGDLLGNPSSTPAAVHDNQRASIDMGLGSIHADAEELEAWLARSLTALRAARSIAKVESLLAARGPHPAGTRAGGGGECHPRSAQRLADEITEGDVLVMGEGQWEEHWTVDRVVRGEPDGWQVTMWFVGRPDPMIAYATTMVRVTVQHGDEQSGEPFVADTDMIVTEQRDRIRELSAERRELLDAEPF